MLKEHESSENLISRALLKHGYLAFCIDIIEYCNIFILTEREQYYLDNLKLTFAYTTLSHKHRTETLKKLWDPFLEKMCLEKIIPSTIKNRALGLKKN